MGYETNRVLRGGSWNNKPQNLRAANRNNNNPTNRNNNIGFRLAKTLPARSWAFKDVQCVHKSLNLFLLHGAKLHNSRVSTQQEPPAVSYF